MSQSINLYGLSIWLLGPALETLILVRGFRAGWLTRYKFFSAYLICVLTQDLSFLAVYFLRFKYYGQVYWCAELFSIALGAGVTWEILELMLGRYPGAGRMARYVLAVVVVATVSATVADAWGGHLFSADSVIKLERNLRITQALSLFVLGILCLHYVIPMGRNAKGLLVGYGIFVGSSVVTLTLRSSLGQTFQKAWVGAQPLCYIVALIVWGVFLWSYQPADAGARPQVEQDYRSLVLTTRRSVAQARAFLLRTMR